MENRRFFGLILSGMLLLLATGTSLALGPQATANRAPASTGPSPGATAPWFVKTVDASPGVGSYVSVAINAQGATYISYYDEPNEVPEDGQGSSARAAIAARATTGRVRRWTTASALPPGCTAPSPSIQRPACRPLPTGTILLPEESSSWQLPRRPAGTSWR